MPPMEKIRVGEITPASGSCWVGTVGGGGTTGGGVGEI